MHRPASTTTNHWPWRAALTGLLVLAAALFPWRLGDRDLWSSHEARAAMDAQGLLDGAAGLPRLFDGRAEVQKPPLYYWLVAELARLRGGVDGVAVRLPAALTGLATLALLAGGCAWRGRPVAGLAAALVLATSIHFPWLARIGRIDVPLTLTVTAAIGGFALALAGCRRRLALVGAWLAVAAGVLLKGPIGLVLPAAAVAGWLLLEGRWPAFWEWAAWRRLLGEVGVAWGLPLVALVCLPVFLWAEHASNGRFFREFFWHHNVERGLGGAGLRSHRWWLYGPYLALYLLPYSPLLLAAAWPRLWRDDRLARLGLGWLLAVLLVLSAARFKRADYLAPAYPGAALFLGCVVERRLAGRLPLLAGLAGLMVAGWAVWLGRYLPAEEPYRDYRPFAGLVRRHAPPPAEVIFFRTEAHALAFRVGRPQAVVVEWPELRRRLAGPGPHHVVLPPAVAAEAARELPGVRLEEVGRTTAAGARPAAPWPFGWVLGLRLGDRRHERPLVLLLAQSEAIANACRPRIASHRRGAPEHRPAGP
jgi:4-amino-4-deoxy-L-arabinose transferase-like glycosyltransferase